METTNQVHTSRLIFTLKQLGFEKHGSCRAVARGKETSPKLQGYPFTYKKTPIYSTLPFREHINVHNTSIYITHPLP